MKTRKTSILIAALAASSLFLAGCSGNPEEKERASDTAAESTSGTETDTATETATETASEAATETEPATESEQPTVEVTQDPEFAAILKDLIVEDLPPISLISSDNIRQDCKVQVGGCYYEDDATIYLTSEYTDFRLPELLAHEYLHYVWFRDNLDSNTALVDALNKAVEDKEGLAALIPPWQEAYVRDDGTVAPTELFSFACTGLRSDQLEPVIAEHCEKYLMVRKLPIYEVMIKSELIAEITKLRESQGLKPLEYNPSAAAASDIRAELFGPYFQVPLDEYPESIRQHLDAGCSPAKYAVRLTRPSDLSEMVHDFDRLLDGGLSSSNFTGLGVSIKDFDYIDATSIFGDKTLKVNATLIVVTICE